MCHESRNKTSYQLNTIPVGRAASLNQSARHIAGYFFLGWNRNTNPNCLQNQCLSNRSGWKPKSWCLRAVPFAASTPRPTANGQTPLAHPRLRSGTRLVLSSAVFSLAPAQVWDMGQWHYRPQCIQKAHLCWHRAGGSEFHKSHTVNLQTRPAAGLHHFLPFGEAQHTCWLICVQLFSQETTGLRN